RAEGKEQERWGREWSGGEGRGGGCREGLRGEWRGERRRVQGRAEGGVERKGVGGATECVRRPLPLRAGGRGGGPNGGFAGVPGRLVGGGVGSDSFRGVAGRLG
ncbi:hypothetical protein ACFVFP_41960, partial [Streptomyces sp. NPDC057686]